MGSQFGQVSLRKVIPLIFALALLGAGAMPARAQSYLQSVGVPSFSTQLPIENGFINAANGNLHLEIPLGTFPQRTGAPDKIVMMYDSAFWFPNAVGAWEPTNISNPWGPVWGGWRVVTSRDAGYTTYPTQYSGNCTKTQDYTYAEYGAWIYVAPDGTQHTFPVVTVEPLYPGICGNSGTPSASGYADDGSGFYMAVTNYTNSVVYAPDGTVLTTPTASGSSEDTNGNYATSPYTTGNPVSWVDTLGRTVLTVTNNSGGVYTLALPNSQGGTSTYTVRTGTINVYTNFGQQYLGEYSGTITVVNEVDLPDGTKYTFTYDSGTTAGHYGLMTQMTLPTGGQISYSFAVQTDAAGNHYTWIKSRSTPNGTWTYGFQTLSSCATGYVDCQQNFTVTKPSADQTIYTFTLNGGDWPTEVQYNDHLSSTTLATTTQCFSFVTVTNGSCSYSVTGPVGAAFNVHLLAQTTTLPIPGTNISATTEYSWDSNNYGELTQIQEWNFGNSPSNAPDRTTAIVYESGSYITANILNLPHTVTVSKYGNTMQYTWLGHDQYALTSVTGMANHDDTNYGTGNNLRGNLTQFSQLVSGSTYLNTLTYYDTTGEPTKTYVSGVGNPATYANVCQNAYPSIITNPLSQITTFGYDCNTGLLTSVKDANNQTTSFSYDNMGRPLTTTYPNGGQTAMSYNYNGSTFTGITTTQKITSSLNLVTQQNLDTLGRDSSDVVTSDPDGQTTIATQYDSNGRVKSVSNPYHSTSDGTYGVTQYGYDGLDRPMTVTDQDNSAAKTYYGPLVSSNGGQGSQLCSNLGFGYPILYVDEAGKKRQAWVDGFGRNIETDEPDANNNLTVGTCYAYDLLNNLIGVLSAWGTQVCSQYNYILDSWVNYTRCFSYDLLSRLTNVTDPESGTIYFSYTNSGGYICSGDPSSVCRRTDARGITTNYQYDSLNRLIQKSYSDSTPTIGYSYDSTNCLGLPTCYNVGHRTGMTDGSGSSSWAYGIMGHIASQSETINNVTKSFSYVNNLDGSLATITYPSGRTLTYTPGGAGRPTAVSDTTNSNSPIPYASSVHYFPFGALSSMMNGPSNILSTWWYSNRLQPCRIAVNTSGSAPSNCNDSNSGNVLDLAYNFNGPSNNGNVTKISNNRSGMSGRNTNYAYDNLNRIAQAYTDATTGSYCWAEAFTIDFMGNLTGIGPKSDHPTCSQESLNLIATWRNRLSTGFGSDYQYDAAGNLIRTPSPESATYTYNGEEQLTQASDFFAAGYLYDGDGKRVAKTSGGALYQLYWYGTNSAPLAVSDASGNFTDEYIFFAGRRIARRVVSGQ